MNNHKHIDTDSPLQRALWFIAVYLALVFLGAQLVYAAAAIIVLSLEANNPEYALLAFIPAYLATLALSKASRM